MTTSMITGSQSLSDLHASLRRIESRLRLREAVGLAPISSGLALGTAFVLTLLSRLTDRVSLPVVLIADGGLVLAAIATSTLYALLRRRDPMQTARRADALLGLDERLATALESAQAHDISPTDRETLREIQLQDAAGH